MEKNKKVIVSVVCGLLIQMTVSYAGGIDLCTAISHKDIHSIKKLISSGINVNTTDKYGSAPLHWAADLGYTESIKPLIEAGADINAKDRYGSIPLYWAVRNHRTETVLELIEHGAELTDDMEDLELFRQNWAFFIECKKLSKNRLRTINSFLGKGNFPKDVIDQCIVPYLELTEAQAFQLKRQRTNSSVKNNLRLHQRLK